MSALLLVSLLLALQDPIEIHVSPTGKDDAAGTASDPVSSPSRARDLVRVHAGKRPVVVHLSPGTYYLPEPLELGPADSGTASAPIVWRATVPLGAVLSAGAPLAGWTPVEHLGSPAWEARIASAPRQLWIDGRRAVRARFPKEGFFRVESLPDTKDRSAWSSRRGISAPRGPA
jgi:hypothetical protein